VHAGFGKGYKLILLLQLALGCVIHERSVLQGYKKIAGPTARASFQFSREGSVGVMARGISAGGQGVVRLLRTVLAQKPCQAYLDGHSICQDQSSCTDFVACELAWSQGQICTVHQEADKKNRGNWQATGVADRRVREDSGATKRHGLVRVLHHRTYCIF
jgi:hypothetical protein